MSKTTGDASKIGGEIEYGDKSMWYNKLEVTDLSNKKIVWKTVDVQGGMPGVEDWLKTEMSFELEEKQLERLQGKRVTVVLFKHFNLPENFEGTKMYAEMNWHWAVILLGLKNVAEGKPGMPM